MSRVDSTSAITSNHRPASHGQKRRGIGRLTVVGVGVAVGIDREFEFYEFFPFLKFNEFYDFFG